MNRATAPTAKAVISIGTNSTRALVVALRPERETLLRRSTGTRVGEGLRESGRLREDAMRRTLDAIAAHVAAVREFQPDLKVIATSALRRAENADAFAHAVQEIAGVPLEIISGEEEARCSYEGAVTNLSGEQSYGVLDAGGGSTEYATRDAYASFEIGAVRLMERFPKLRGVAGEDEIDAARSYARAKLHGLRDFEKVDRLIMVGGSAATACALASGGRTEFQTMLLERDALPHLVDQLAPLPLEERKKLRGMPAQRADILLAGAIILDEACVVTGHSEALVSTNDLLLGYLLRH